ncbi:2-nitropropane dioxygenase [Streptomyces sulfonofaciens]|uniref:2-nitropropane dioxygenase n=1 Tax=Streptomyces sulfonofaciens TaxID=68272 RepID=A0A919FWH2_9ACTN|nr:nitronate monooxygenase [Streptomyces sulfonofaciens]GHH73199.1 2-nitropropane dioxygenase [Streptomyces sulfonofaciens]
MAWTTALTELLGIDCPVVCAPMGGSAGGALAAAVSRGGGLGMVGGGRGERAWLERELSLVTQETTRPWGVGFLSWAVDGDTVARALEYRPAAVMLSFGDPRPFAGRVREAGVPLLVQVTSLAEAVQALDAGADVLVAQGTEAGGHGGGRATLPFVPAVVDAAAPTPVLAAGGIADGRGVAAALALGAAGALMGTRFQASREALVPARVLKALVEGRGEDTHRSRVLDIARGAPWPARYTARTLRNDFLVRWHGREAELGADAAALEQYRAAVARGDTAAVPVWAGEAVDLINGVDSAADIVAEVSAQAARALASAVRLS